MEYNGKWRCLPMEISANIQFICEFEGLYTYWVKYGDSGKLVQIREEDLDDEDP